VTAAHCAKIAYNRLADGGSRRTRERHVLGRGQSDARLVDQLAGAAAGADGQISFDLAADKRLCKSGGSCGTTAIARQANNEANAAPIRASQSPGRATIDRVLVESGPRFNRTAFGWQRVPNLAAANEIPRNSYLFRDSEKTTVRGTALPPISGLA
jgi:hypothetical protein